MDGLLVRDICVSVGGGEVVRGVDLTVGDGEIHLLMGPNGSGKSTLAHAIMGSPLVSVTQGSVSYRGKDITFSPPEERATMGLYLGFQYPVELPGVGMATFLRNIRASRGHALASEEEDRIGLIAAASLTGLASSFLDRSVNEGFSGGEKKRGELLQLLALEPHLAILDEFDSGLDVDGIRAASLLLKDFMKEKGRSLLLITHYGTIAHVLEPTAVHIMMEGRIVARGGKELIRRVAEHGFGYFVSKNFSENYG